MNTESKQKKLVEIQGLKSDIDFLTKLKNRLNPEKAYAQEVAHTIIEEISLLAYQKMNLVEEYEKMIIEIPSFPLPAEKNKIADKTGEETGEKKANYIPVNPPVSDIYSSLKVLKNRSPHQPKKSLGYGSGSLV